MDQDKEDVEGIAQHNGGYQHQLDEMFEILIQKEYGI